MTGNAILNLCIHGNHEAQTRKLMASSGNDDNFQLVFNSIKAVLRAAEEVDCQTVCPGSLKTVGDLFSTRKANSVLKDFSLNLVQAIRSPLQSIPQGKPKLFKESSLSTFHQLRIRKLPSVWKSLSERITDIFLKQF